MRTYLKEFRCSFYSTNSNIYINNKKAVDNPCWSKINDNKKNFIIITYFKTNYTKKYIKDLLYWINQITTCYITKDIHNEDVIVFEKTKNYYSSLFLLNFIRLLWYDVRTILDVDNFFKELKDKREIDPVLKLTTSLKNNIILKSQYFWGNHNHIYKENIPKTMMDFIFILNKDHEDLISNHKFMTTKY